MNMDITEFYQTFFDEADELLNEMEHLLIDLDPDNPGNDALHAIFRAAHSIKGGAGTFGFTHLQNTTHLLESLLDKARHGEMALDRQTVDVFLEARDTLKDQLDAYRNEEEPDQEAYDRICEMLKRIAHETGVHHESPTPSESQPEAGQQSEADRPLVITVRDIAEKDSEALSGELALFGDITGQDYTQEVLTVHMTSTADEDDIAAVLCFLVDAEQLDIKRDDTAKQLEDTPETATASDNPTVESQPAPSSGSPAGQQKKPAKDHKKSHTESSTLRVSTDKIDQIINLVGELVITQSMLDQTTSELDGETYDSLVEGMGQLQRNARDLQEAIMSVRMMPMDYAFSRFPRLIRDLSSKLGKQVTLKTEGESTELDKGLIEHIMDPLTHLVRNSLDHGIELPDERIAAGKPAAGTLTLAAQHQGGNILIEISDDGAGLDRSRILAKAEENGLPISDNMPDDDVWKLIFEPGFSTAEKVTDVSGRGVGMDVVRSNINKLGGHVDIRSVTGQGSTISIALPLTLAIMEGMSIKVGDEVFIIPLGAIMESMQITDDQINMVAGDERVLHVRGEYLALVELHRVFDVTNAETDVHKGIVMVLQSEGRRFAVLVDQLLGQHQVVVKNLETNYRKVNGVSAATILGDGSVALILDVVALSRSSARQPQRNVPREPVASQEFA